MTIPLKTRILIAHDHPIVLKGDRVQLTRYAIRRGLIQPWACPGSGQDHGELRSPPYRRGRAAIADWAQWFASPF